MAGSLDPRGPLAAEIAGLWWLMLWLGVAVFVVFAVVLAVGLLRRRAAADDPPTSEWDEPPAVRRLIIGLGVVMPAVVLVVVFGATLATMRATAQAVPDDALIVHVVGRQFSWEVTYPEQDVRLTNELRMPVGRPVVLRLISEDVIHAFWVPQLAGKIDVMPGRTNTLVFQADEAGEYRGVCAEFCGLYHAHHEFVVVAEPAERFLTWMEGAR